jgi:crotonobetainyl-CoA:carnitine CoA-transferase CaiB-like acyl-CoA transferase
MYEKAEDAILAGYRVLDLTDDKGRFCIKTMAGMGAEIVRVSPENDLQSFRALVKNADIFVETSPPGYLESLGADYKSLKKLNTRLIMVSITPFGQDGPYRTFKASDLTLQALGGWLSVTGEPDAPLKLYGDQAYNVASLFAVNGILLALWQRHDTGRGQHIDISIMECVAATMDHVLPRYFYGGIVSERQGSQHWNNAFRIFKCADGYILLSLHLHWETLVEWMASEGLAGDLTDERWRDREERNRHIGHIIEAVERWTLKHKAKELAAKGQLMRFPWAEVKAVKSA